MAKFLLNSIFDRSMLNMKYLEASFNNLKLSIAKKAVEKLQEEGLIDSDLSDESQQAFIDTISDSVEAGYEFANSKEGKKNIKSKREPSPYILFCNDKRSEVQENKELKPKEVTAELAKMWRSLSDKQKKKYEDQYKVNVETSKKAKLEQTKKTADKKAKKDSKKSDKKADKKDSKKSDKKTDKKTDKKQKVVEEEEYEDDEAEYDGSEYEEEVEDEEGYEDYEEDAESVATTVVQEKEDKKTKNKKAH